MSTTYFELKKPGAFNLQGTWLKNYVELRARVLYNKGERPFFKKNDGSFNDTDEFEADSYHLLAYKQERLIGGVRLLPLQYPYHCVSSKIVGKDVFNRIISEFFIQTDRFPAEVNRWVVDPAFQNTRVGIELMGVILVFAQSIGLTVIGNGNKTKTEHFHATHTGGFIFPGTTAYQSDVYNDNEIVLYFIDKSKMSPFLLKVVNKVMPFIKTDIDHPYLLQSRRELNRC